MRNEEQYVHTLFWSPRFWIGLLVNVHYPGSSFLEAASRLEPQWPDWGGGEGGVPWVERGRSLLHIIPIGPGRAKLHNTPAWGGGWPGWRGKVSAPHNSKWARQGRAPQYTSFFCMAHWTQLHTWCIDQDRLYPIFSLSGSSKTLQGWNVAVLKLYRDEMSQ
jgi:hypothetical protein